MAVLGGVIGALLVAVANYDALVTTVSVGSGWRPLTTHVSTLLRRVLRRFPRFLPAGGPLVVLTTVAVWIGLLWAGYSLIFAADPAAVTSATTGVPAAGISRVYYAGYTLFTLGNGGYTPAAGFWEIVTTITVLNGLVVATLAVTYLVPVVSAVVERRQLASLVTALGTTAEDVAIGAWNGEDFSYLESQLPTLAQQILLTAQRHLAYPVLHDFRSSDPRTASERTLALLDDVVTMLHSGVAPEVALPAPVVRTVRFAIDEASRLMPTEAVGHVPPPPDLGALQAAGIPTRPSKEFEPALHAQADRRRRLASLVDAAAWRWPNRAGEAT